MDDKIVSIKQFTFNMVHTYGSQWYHYKLKGTALCIFFFVGPIGLVNLLTAKACGASKVCITGI